MPKVVFTTGLADKVLEDLAAQYEAIPEPLLAVDRRVLRKTAELCGGNWHKCTAEPDGSIIVWNRPVW